MRASPPWKRGCEKCGVITGTLVIWHVRPASTWEGGVGPLSYGRTLCIDRATCEARKEKKRARSVTRSSLLVIVEPKAGDAPPGTCRWCGEAIVTADGEPDRDAIARRRGFHQGPESYRYGVKTRKHEPNCYVAWMRSRTYDARRAIELRGDPRCVDCGDEDAPWEADHERALEDGGEHTMENLRRRCVPCHAAKTARENAARAKARQPPSAQEELAVG